jgi:hypothetical protein
MMTDTSNGDATTPDPDRGGVGTEGTIPAHPDGLAVGVSEEGSNFNHEEDPESAAEASDDPGAAAPSPDLV